LLKGDEPGKPFHLLYPFFIGGENVLGTIVIAKDPGKPQAIFETIDSVDYRNPNSTINLETGDHPLAGANTTTSKNIGAALVFAQLDAILNGAKNAPASGSLLAKVCTPPTTQGNGSPNTSSSATADTASSSAAGQGAGSGASKTGDSCNQSSMTSTGIDFSRFTGGTVNVSKAHILFYKNATLNKLESQSDNAPLNTLGKQTLSKAKNGWIISQVVVADSLSYDLITNTDIEAGFFAHALAWLPTLSVKFVDKHTVRVTSNVPVVVGYKLWRPGGNVIGSASVDPNGNGQVGETADANSIEKLLTQGGN
jgi:hypothetical protein